MHHAQAAANAALAAFDGIVLQAVKETAEAISAYTAELDHHRELVAVQMKSRSAFDLARDQLSAGAISELDFLTSERAVVSADAAVAASDAAVVQDQIAVFKALGGGWQKASPRNEGG